MKKIILAALVSCVFSAPAFAFGDEDEENNTNPWSSSYESPYDKMRKENRGPFYEDSIRREDRIKVDAPKRDRSDNYSYDNKRKAMSGGEVISNMLREKR